MEIDTRARLHDSIDLIVKGDTHTQCLDYKNVPFLCHRWHALGIFCMDLSSPFNFSFWQKEESCASTSNIRLSYSPSQILVPSPPTHFMRSEEINNCEEFPSMGTDAIRV